ncbi:putative TLC domain-containing protein [Lachnellula willkommii]|uniref:Putative TLC domain-containing protein n=1 Tax=Lachnellula willkommii TaxID=215461 RepID=A0A559M5K2_9HELO|nr:putative TLC domain-containing protein [Lachnellula willkommii]
MLDPFFAPFPLFKESIQPLCDTLHLYSLPLHIHEILSAFAIYHIIFEYIAAPLSTALLPKSYTGLSWESKLRWNMHCVSLVQSVSISVLALWVMGADQERKTMNLEERLWGYTGAAGMVQALATGYFLFDLSVMIRYLDVFGVGMLTHASSCLLTYTLGFRPVFNYYGCVFMLYELSTPFLNIHWFFDKLGMTGSKAQLYNGLALVSVFFSCRLVWGAYSSFNIYKDVWDSLHITNDMKFDSRPEMMVYGQDRSLPWWLVALYLGGHVTLQVLNVFWLGRMIAAIRKRFSSKVKVNGKAE